MGSTVTLRGKDYTVAGDSRDASFYEAQDRPALRGKDYCNCEHASVLREAIESALTALAAGSEYGATLTLKRALATDADACHDLWNDLRENIYTKESE